MNPPIIWRAPLDGGGIGAGAGGTIRTFVGGAGPVCACASAGHTAGSATPAATTPLRKSRRVIRPFGIHVPQTIECHPRSGTLRAKQLISSAGRNCRPGRRPPTILRRLAITNHAPCVQFCKKTWAAVATHERHLDTTVSARTRLDWSRQTCPQLYAHMGSAETIEESCHAAVRSSRSTLSRRQS